MSGFSVHGAKGPSQTTGLSNAERAEAQPKADQPSPHGVGESVRSPVADPAEIERLERLEHY
jgi:hypothetical protein